MLFLRLIIKLKHLVGAFSDRNGLETREAGGTPAAKYTIMTAGTDRKTEGTSDDSGNVEEKDLIPGDISIVPSQEEEKKSEPSSDGFYNGDEK